ncbi:MAG TPA: serine/threonine-protein kinase [Myxococcaceae bacterium]|jgi:serine/threonine-protein kinase
MDATGKYSIVRKIADGGMAEIFLARLEGTRGFHKQVVLKRIRSALIADPQFRNMLIDEAHVAMGLNHGNIAQVLELGESSGHYFLALELVDGWSLSEVIKRANAAGLPLPIELSLYIVVEVCRALSYAHQQTVKGVPMGIVHRDVSPQNVLVSEQGEVKLTDFGIAKARTNTEQTSRGVVKGKISYMSPEQAAGGEIDHRSDLFSLGIVLYAMVTGKLPFEGGAPLEVMVRIQAGEYPAPDKVNKKLGKELVQVIQKAMTLRKEDRYQNAEAMLLAVERVLRDGFPPTGRTELKAFLDELHRRDGVLPISRAASATTETEVSKDPVEIGSSMMLTTPEPVQRPVPRRSGERPRPKRSGSARRAVLGIVGAVGLVLVLVVMLSPEPASRSKPPESAPPETAVVTATPAPPPPPDPSPPPAPAPAPEATPAPTPEAVAAQEATATDAGSAEVDEDEAHLMAEAVADPKDVVIGEEDGTAEDDPPASASAPPVATPEPAPAPTPEPAKPTPEPIKTATAPPPPPRRDPPKPAPAPTPPKPDTVSVLITSQPVGAVVKLKSRVFGKTPIPLRFKTGIIFELTFVKDGFATTSKRFLVTKKKDQKVVAYLSAVPRKRR